MGIFITSRPTSEYAGNFGLYLAHLLICHFGHSAYDNNAEHRIRCAVAAIVFGLAVEIIQPHFGRGFEIHDLFSNMLGVGAGWYIGKNLGAYLKFK